MPGMAWPTAVGSTPRVWTCSMALCPQRGLGQESDPRDTAPHFPGAFGSRISAWQVILDPLGGRCHHRALTRGRHEGHKGRKPGGESSWDSGDSGPPFKDTAGTKAPLQVCRGQVGVGRARWARPRFTARVGAQCRHPQSRPRDPPGLVPEVPSWAPVTLHSPWLWQVGDRPAEQQPRGRGMRSLRQDPGTGLRGVGAV